METKQRMRVVRATWVVLLGIVIGFSAEGYAQATAEFRWIDRQTENALWSKVRLALRDELKPDTPSPDTIAYAYKFVDKVGLLNNSALVIVGHKLKEHPERDQIGSEYSEAFNFELSSGSLSRVANPENGQPLSMWQWKFVNLARFEPSVAPDVVFRYRTCWECEPETILSALHYDPGKHQWQIRRWGNGKPLWWVTPVGLVFDEDVYGGDDTVSYDCMYGLLDLNKDGFDDLAMRCREVSEPIKNKTQISDSTILYSLKQGHFTGEVVTSGDQRSRIWSELCRVSAKKKLCNNVARPK
jgi:hypothetical protein